MADLRWNNVLIEVQQITVRFGQLVALNDFSCTFPQGQISAVVGQNGAGKSTLLDVVSGLRKPNVGHVFVNGIDVTAYTTYRRARIGISRSFQDSKLFANMTVLENIQSGSPRSFKGINRQINAKELLDKWEMGDFAECFARDLSGGQSKTVSILRALMSDSPVLLLDEPTAALSPERIELLLPELERQSKLGRVVVIVEHNFDFVQRISNLVYVLKQGELGDCGSPSQVLKRYFE